MELEVTNRLFLELSQFATATTNSELELEKIITDIIARWRLYEEASHTGGNKVHALALLKREIAYAEEMLKERK
jgi:hypothetical protein